MAAGVRIRLKFALVICGAFATVAPLPAASAAPSPETVIHGFWNKLLVQCGNSYFYGGSVFDDSGMIGGVMRGDQRSVYEFRGVKFNTVSVRITDAERMNGLEYHARVTMMAHLFREAGETWQDGPDLQARNANDIIGSALRDVGGDMGEMGSGGAMAFDFMKAKGTWAIARSSSTLSGPLNSHSDYYDVQKLLAEKSDRYNCKTGAVEPPPPTAAELAEKKKADLAAAEEERKRRQQAAEIEKFEQDRAQKAAKREADAEARVAPWRFTGTPEGFRVALLANLAKRAKEFGVDPNDYNDEVEAVMRIVATCTGITKEEYEAASALPYHDRQARLQDCDGSAKDIGVVWGLKLSPPYRARCLDVRRSVTAFDGGQFRRSDRFKITVLFLQQSPQEAQARGVGELNDIDGAFAVIVAEIPFSVS